MKRARIQKLIVALATFSLLLSLVAPVAHSHGLMKIVSDVAAESSGRHKGEANTPMAHERIRSSYGRLPLSFEANMGQVGSSAKFILRNGSYEALLLSTGVEFALRSSAEKDRTPAREPLVMKMNLPGANPNARIQGWDQLPGKTNYFIGNDPATWRTNIPNYAKVKYESIYNGIDLVYYGKQQRLEYDFVVAPGAKPSDIRLRFERGQEVAIDTSGDLVIQTAAGPVRQLKPVVYQEGNGRKMFIEGRYKLTANREVGFEIGKYDSSRPLVIDPVFIYSTYFGDAGNELARGIAVDSAGSAYIIGSVFVQRQNVFIAKLNEAGTALSYLTFLGGTSGDSLGYGIAVGAHGHAYLTGYSTSTTFPVANALQSTRRGWANAFVTKLTPAGLIASSTYLGGSDPISGRGDFGLAIALDSAGNAFVTGETTSIDYPVVNAFQPVKGGLRDSFLAKLDPNLSALLFSTYLGGSSTEGGNPTSDSVSTRPGNRIAVDRDGNCYVTGYTFSTNLPVVQAFQPTKRGESDAYVGKFSPTGVPAYITYLGGSGTGSDFAHGDYAYAIACDSFGNAFVAGDTTSVSFPTVNAIKSTKSGARDLFVTKINPQGSAILFSTYIGGSDGNEGANSIAVDADGSVLVTGVTSASNFPTTNLLQPARGGSDDAFLFKLNASGSALIFSSYIGGSGGDTGAGVAVDDTGKVYLTGSTVSANFPTTGPLQAVNGGQFDAFIARIDPVVFSVIAIQANKGGNTGEVSAAIIGGGFQPGATVKLVAQDQPDIEGVSPIVNNSSNMTATFDLRGAEIGVRDVVVTRPDGSTTSLRNGFTVEAGRPGQLHVDIVAPEVLRQGRQQVVTITYTNKGNINLPAPLFELSSPQPVRFGFFESANFQSEPLRIFAGGYPGSAGLVPPGSFSLQVRVISQVQLGQVRLDLSVIETGEHVFSWDQFAQVAVPAGAGGSDWHARVTRARSVIGESFDNVMTVLRNGATESLESANAFYDFDNFLTYTVGILGTNETEFSGNVAVNFANKKLQRSSRKLTHHAAAAEPVALITIAEQEHPSETFVLTPGLGGLRGFDGNRTDFFQAAAAIQRTHPNANIYIVDTTESLKTNLFTAASRINQAGAAGYDLLKAKGPIFFDPAKATFIGESFGNSVNNRMAKGFADEGVRVKRGLILNPANLLGFPVGVKQHFERSVSASSNSLFDTRQKFADLNLELVTDTLNQVKKHISGIVRLIDHPEIVDTAFDPNLRGSSNPLISDGSIKLDGSCDPTPTTLVVRNYLINTLFPLPILLKTLFVNVVASRDPNDKFGLSGVTASRYILGTEALRYLVVFENVPSATAAAQEVVITDQLDPAKVELASFAFGPITIGDRQLIPPPVSNEFIGTLDLRPANDLIVKVVARLDKDTGLITWKFTSLDPATGLPTENALAGFLPPNTNPPDGEGSVFFTVNPKPELPTGTEIRNQASIIFDENAAIQTPAWLNTLDNSNPTSSVLPVAPTQSSTSFEVRWSGIDDGSGIRDFSVLVSQDGQPYSPWLTNVTSTQSTFVGQAGSTYSFHSIARDLTNNQEGPKTIAEATTLVNTQDTEAPTITRCAASRSVSTNGSLQIALPDLTTEVVAADNQTPASQLSITQLPAAGSLIGPGITPVILSVTDTANNSTTCVTTVSVSQFALKDFVVLSTEFTGVHANVRIFSGNVGTNTSQSQRGGGRDNNEEVEIGEGTQMLGVGSGVMGDTLRIRSNALVQNVFFNEMFGARGTIAGERFTPLLLPLINMPPLASINPGNQNIEVDANQTKTLTPGRYHRIRIKNRGILILRGGVYEISSLDVGSNAKILFMDPAEVRVENEMDTDSGTYIGPHTSALTLKASQIVFLIGGPDDKGRRHDEDGGLTPTAVQIGQRNIVLANIYTPNGTVWLKSKTEATGAFIGNRARIGEGVKLRLASAF